nr:hypothetical protein [Nannocystis sp.]
MEAEDVEEVGALGEGEALEQEAVGGRRGVGPGVDGRVAAQADGVDRGGGEAGELAVVDDEGEAVAVAAEPLHEGGGLGGEAVVEVEAEALELGEDAATGVAGAQGEADLRAGGEAVVEGRVDELERVEVELEAGAEAADGAVDGAGEQRAMTGDPLACAQSAEVGRELDDRGGRDGAEDLREEQVAEGVDEGRGGGVEAGVHAGGEEGVGLDQALKVGVVGRERAGEAGVEVGEAAGGAAEVLELALVEVEVVHIFLLAEVDAAAGGEEGAQAQGDAGELGVDLEAVRAAGADLDAAQARLVAGDRGAQAVLQGGAGGGELVQQIGEVGDAEVGGGRAVTGAGVEEEAQVGEHRAELVVAGEALQAGEEAARCGAIGDRHDSGDGLSRDASGRQRFGCGFLWARRSCERGHRDCWAWGGVSDRERGW